MASILDLLGYTGPQQGGNPPEWLLRLLGAGRGRGLVESIAAVLGKNERVLAPTAPGARPENPIRLDPVTVTTPHTLPPQGDSATAALYALLSERGSWHPEIMQAPLMTDTVAGLVGGPVKVHESLLPRLLGVAGMAHPMTRRILVSPNADPTTFFHEAAHIGDFRNDMPEFEEFASKNFAKQRELYPGVYASTSEKEYVAELFANALDRIRTGGVWRPYRYDENQGRNVFEEYNPTAAYHYMMESSRHQDIYGLDEMVKLLLRKPMFQHHPMTRQMAELESMLNQLEVDMRATRR